LINGLFNWLRNVGNSAIGFVNRVRGAAGMQPIQGFARGGHVSGPTLAWVGEGGDPGGEYIIPAKKMAGASMAYLSGARGASVIPKFATGGFVGGGKTKSRKNRMGMISKAPSQESMLKVLDATFRNAARIGDSLGVSLSYQVARANITKPAQPGRSSVSVTLDPERNSIQALQERLRLKDTSIKKQPIANDGPINITTGPVLEFDGQRYVTMEDYQRGLRDVKRQTLGEIRTAAGRRATGR
jgi:hypothetical protein